MVQLAEYRNLAIKHLHVWSRLIVSSPYLLSVNSYVSHKPSCFLVNSIHALLFDSFDRYSLPLPAPVSDIAVFTHEAGIVKLDFLSDVWYAILLVSMSKTVLIIFSDRFSGLTKMEMKGKI